MVLLQSDQFFWASFVWSRRIQPPFMFVAYEIWGEKLSMKIQKLPPHRGSNCRVIQQDLDNVHIWMSTEDEKRKFTAQKHWAWSSKTTWFTCIIHVLHRASIMQKFFLRQCCLCEIDKKGGRRQQEINRWRNVLYVSVCMYAAEMKVQRVRCSSIIVYYY